MNANEVNGMAVLQKLLSLQLLKGLFGTLITIPLLNVHSLFMSLQTFSDQNDLENSFPGCETGSFSSRIAFLLSKEIFHLATHCIDLRSGSFNTYTAPQVHTNLKIEIAKNMAKIFQPPFIFDTDSKQGMFHLHQKENPIPTIVYQTGELNRLDKEGVKEGVRGIIRVMRELKMLAPLNITPKDSQKVPLVIESPISTYSPYSGLCKFYQSLGTEVKKDSLIAVISDPLGTKSKEKILSPSDGILMSRSTKVLIHEGECIFQIGQSRKTESEFWQANQEPIE